MTEVIPSLPLPDPPLADDVVALRAWHPEDAPALAAAWHDAEIARWTAVPEDRSEAAARRWILGEADRRARALSLDLVVIVGDGVAGEVGLSNLDAERAAAEIGWWTAERFRGHGLASRAASLVAAWAVTELCVERVYARCPLANPASGAVARAAGLTVAGRADPHVEVYVGPEGGGTVPP